MLEAKAAGYTEPDPRDDLSGMDVARKVSLYEGRRISYTVQGIIIPMIKFCPYAGYNTRKRIRIEARAGKCSYFELSTRTLAGNTYFFCIAGSSDSSSSIVIANMPSI